jgi:hypothetical protein
MWPSGVKLTSRGEDPLITPPFFYRKECVHPLEWTKGWEFTPRGATSPLWVNISHERQTYSCFKNLPQVETEFGKMQSPWPISTQTYENYYYQTNYCQAWILWISVSVGFRKKYILELGANFDLSFFLKTKLPSFVCTSAYCDLTTQNNSQIRKHWQFLYSTPPWTTGHKVSHP